MALALDIHDVWKQYRLGEIGTGTLSHDLKRWAWKAAGKGDPYAEVGDVNDREAPGDRYVWALRQINLQVPQGEVLGIVGKNGAGKSTLLKLLSRVSLPTRGRICARGRIASLLEVGTGMHPELTGRENVYLNGSILGMRRPEITARFDDIVAFSGCARYIDTPVKRYSSGMKVRLGFAVAAFLEPEILIVDEVLAVGDAEFQRKAIGKMHDVTRSGNRTVLFVSHNMAAVQSLCTRAVVVEKGTLTHDGTPALAVQQYLRSSTVGSDLASFAERKGNGAVRITRVETFAERPGQTPQCGSPCSIVLHLDNATGITAANLRADLRIDDHHGQRVAWLSTSLLNLSGSEPVHSITFHIPRLALVAGTYYLTLYMEAGGNVADWIQNAASFDVADGDYYGTGRTSPPGQAPQFIDFKAQYHV